MASSGPAPRGTAPHDHAEPSRGALLDAVAHAMDARILAFELARGPLTSALDRAVLRCARDLRDLLMRAASIVRDAPCDADHELAARLRVAYAWIVERLDHFSGSPPAEATSAAAASLAWFNVPRAIDDQVLAILSAAEGERAPAALATLAPVARRLRGAMHRLSLLTTNAV